MYWISVRPLELRALPEDYRKASACQLHAAREIEYAELLADGHVVENLPVGILPFAPFADDDVGGGVHARRDFRRGQVGYHEESLAQIAFDDSELRVDFGDPVADLAHLLLGGGDVAALLGDAPDVLGRGVALRLQGLGLADEGATLLVERPGLLDPLLFDAAPRERGGRRFEIVSYLLYVYHFGAPLSCYIIP